MPNTCITLPRSYIELFENGQKKEILYVSEFREEKKNCNVPKYRKNNEGRKEQSN